jgi:hypothetical protein
MTIDPATGHEILQPGETSLCGYLNDTDEVVDMDEPLDVSITPEGYDALKSYQEQQSQNDN